jgi:hypothetical protein
MLGYNVWQLLWQSYPYIPTMPCSQTLAFADDPRARPFYNIPQKSGKPVRRRSSQRQRQPNSAPKRDGSSEHCGTIRASTGAASRFKYCGIFCIFCSRRCSCSSVRSTFAIIADTTGQSFSNNEQFAPPKSKLDDRSYAPTCPIECRAEQAERSKEGENTNETGIQRKTLS